MIKRIVLFDDEDLDQRQFRSIANSRECEILIIDHPRVPDFAAEVISFKPDIAVVDIEFPQSQVAGRHILRFLKTECDNVPIIVWSKQMDSPELAKRLYEHCEAIGGVQGLFGKHGGLTWDKIVAAAEKRLDG